MTFDIGLHEVCVRVGVRYVITKFSRMDSLPNFVTHGAPLRALRARELRYDSIKFFCQDFVIVIVTRKNRPMHRQYISNNNNNISFNYRIG